jgi:glycogen synthase
MRLLITTDPVGGVWTYTRELIEGLLAAAPDLSISLVSFGRALAPEQQLWADRTAAWHPQRFRLTASDAPLEWMQSNSGCYKQTEAVLVREIASFGPDLLHFNQFCPAALSTSLPKLVVAHSDVLSWHCAVHGCTPAPSPWLQTYQQLVQIGLDGADFLAAPTQWMLGALQQGFSVSCPRAVLANGSALAPSAAPAPRKLQAVTVGRLWDPGKNVRMLADVRSQVPMLVAGEVQLEAAPFEAPHLALLGALEEQRLRALFRESAIYIATSLYEPFGLAPLEAALAGCALVLHDLASLREVWADAALYFDTAAELGQLLDTLAADPQQLHALAQRAGQRARLFTQDAMVSSYRALYAQLTRGEVQHVA